MKALGYFLLIPLSMILYVVLATGMGIYQRYPVPHFLIMAVGLFFLARLIRQKFSIWRLLTNIGAWALALFFGWWTLSYSTFPELESPIAIGKNAEIMSLEFPNSTAQNTTLANLAGDSNAVLITFYRGHW